MATSTKKTRDEIDALVENWMEDPYWDLEHTEGFEAHQDELKSFRIEQEKRWEAERNIRDKEQAELKGMTVEYYREWKCLKDDAIRHKQEAKKLLKHYFGLNISMRGDNAVEIEGIVDHIVEAGVKMTQAVLIPSSK